MGETPEAQDLGPLCSPPPIPGPWLYPRALVCVPCPFQDLLSILGFIEYLLHTTSWWTEQSQNLLLRGFYSTGMTKAEPYVDQPFLAL